VYTLTAVATTEPLGGFSLYLGVPATKITIAMAREKARRMTGNKLEPIDEKIKVTVMNQTVVTLQLYQKTNQKQYIVKFKDKNTITNLSNCNLLIMMEGIV